MSMTQASFSRCRPFIKWVGGKRSLLDQIMPHLPQSFGNYFEPFVGGGALFFELHDLGVLEGKKAYLFDINSELINAYKVVRDDPQKLIADLADLELRHSKELYYEVRSQDRSSDFALLDPIKRASRFIYLNKTCYNGLHRVNSKGEFNAPCGSYIKPHICDHAVIKRASKALQNAQIHHASYKDVLKEAKKGDLIYLDPPYYPLTKSANFTAYSKSSFAQSDQMELFEIFKTLDDRGCKVLKSNSDASFVRMLYSEFQMHEILASRTINRDPTNRGRIKELLIKGKNWHL